MTKAAAAHWGRPWIRATKQASYIFAIFFLGLTFGTMALLPRYTSLFFLMAGICAVPFIIMDALEGKDADRICKD